MLTEIGDEIGVASGSRLREPNPTRASQDQVRVQISLSARLEFVMPWIFPPDSQPVDLQLIYEGLQNFCSYCGSIRHLYDSCMFPTKSSGLGQSSSPPDSPSPSTNTPVISLPVSQEQQVVFSSSTLCPLPTPQDASQEPMPKVSAYLQPINTLPTTITNFRSQRQQSEFAPPPPIRETGGGVSPSHGDRATPNSQNTTSTTLTIPLIPVLKVSDEDRQPLSKKRVSQDSEAKADDGRGPSCPKSPYRRVTMRSRYAFRKNP